MGEGGGLPNRPQLSPLFLHKFTYCESDPKSDCCGSSNIPATNRAKVHHRPYQGLEE